MFSFPLAKTDTNIDLPQKGSGLMETFKKWGVLVQVSAPMSDYYS